MTDLKNLGTKGEELAVKYLIDNNFEILERNWRSKQLEIDIIARKGRFVTFIEVKTRSGNPLQQPTDAVNKNKQKLLIRAANSYIFTKNIQEEVRFDIVAIIVNNNSTNIQHIEDAFYPTLR